MKTTNEKIAVFMEAAAQWMAKHPGRSKFAHALHRVMDRANRTRSAYSEALQDINVDHAATDATTKVILKDQHGGIAMTKEDTKNANAAIRKLYREKEVEIEPYMATDVPDDLTYAEEDAFAGFVIPAQEPELRAVA